MIQEKIKAQLDQIKGQTEKQIEQIKGQTEKQLEQIKGQGDKLQAALTKQLDTVKGEGVRILREMGAEVKDDQINVKAVVAELRAANPTLKDFIKKIDVATYDNRFRASWNANMSAAYAKLQAQEAFLRDIKPRIEEARTQVEAQVSKLQSRAQELRVKIAG